MSSSSKLAWISEELCIGCGICVKVRPQAAGCRQAGSTAHVDDSLLRAVCNVLHPPDTAPRSSSLHCRYCAYYETSSVSDASCYIGSLGDRDKSALTTVLCTVINQTPMAQRVLAYNAMCNAMQHPGPSLHHAHASLAACAARNAPLRPS